MGHNIVLYTAAGHILRMGSLIVYYSMIGKVLEMQYRWGAHMGGKRLMVTFSVTTMTWKYWPVMGQF
jgi:hypothetical protein